MNEMYTVVYPDGRPVPPMDDTPGRQYDHAVVSLTEEDAEAYLTHQKDMWDIDELAEAKVVPVDASMAKRWMKSAKENQKPGAAPHAGRLRFTTQHQESDTQEIE